MARASEKGEEKKQSNNQVEKLVEAPVEFVREGSQFLAKCKKPDLKEYTKIVKAVGIGFIAVGIIGYAIKLIHIPIRYVIV
ncbi:AVN_HP_G0001210.mRNA.1.CDS.1 [Saccharomyces cerevisiae]|nr:Sss1p [Saccharomyces cerevisiae YJM1463]AJV18046.1 Sss1p [Saccharomyces cerevisiae YJM1549]KZV12323.1 SSS1 [Saccharomyces cerevisiae]ONH73073.1 Protein transport protein SSS1 [Saccharomyces cerevisiae]CAI4331213.1 BFP_1a_G0009460.mRNA.1.CDS.1 [Saccharomyces cerevisiae]